MNHVLFRSFLLLVLLGVLPVSCCQQTAREYVYPQELALDLADPAGAPLTSGAHTTAAELLATLHIKFDLVAQGPVGSPFISSAYALQCAPEGLKGLKSNVTEVVVTSTGLFNGKATGQSLNAFVRCSGGYGRADFPLAQLVDSLNKWPSYKLYAPLVLRISPKPTDNSRQQFRVRLRTANARELTQSTPEIIWD